MERLLKHSFIFFLSLFLLSVGILFIDEATGQDESQVSKLIEALKDPSEYVREGAAISLRSIGPAAAPAVPQLIEALEDLSEYVRNEATEALGMIGAPAVIPLIAALQDPSVPVRMRVMSILGNIGPAAAPAIPQLIEALQDVPQRTALCGKQ